jgi:hypothetical protein
MNYKLIFLKAYTDWFNDKKSIFLLLSYFLIGVIFLGLIIGAVMIFFPDLTSLFLGLNSACAAQNNESCGTALSLLINSFSSNLIAFIALIVPFILIQAILQFFISLLIYSRALNLNKFNAVPITVNKFIKIILLLIWNFLIVFSSWYSKKLFYFFIALISLSLLTFVSFYFNTLIGGILSLLLLLLSLIYFFIIIYNDIRLSFGLIIFLQKNQGIDESLRESWKITEKQFIEIFIALLLISIPLIIVFSLLNGLISPLLGIVFSNFNSALIKTSISSIQTALNVIITAFGFIAIYSEVIKEKMN